MDTETIKTIVWSGFFTIITGVFVFIISQLFVFLYLKPRQARIDAAGILSSEMLQLTNKYTNFQLTDADVQRIKNAGALYVAAVWESGGCFSQKDKRKNALELAQNINLIASLSFMEDLKLNRLEKLIKAIDEIEKLDKNVKIRFDR